MSFSNVRGYKNRPVEVEASFVPHMLNIGKIAMECQVTVGVFTLQSINSQAITNL